MQLSKKQLNAVYGGNSVCTCNYNKYTSLTFYRLDPDECEKKCCKTEPLAQNWSHSEYTPIINKEGHVEYSELKNGGSCIEIKKEMTFSEKALAKTIAILLGTTRGN